MSVFSRAKPFLGQALASVGWGQIDEGAAATADGIIPFADPFEDHYANPDGTVDDVYLWSRLIAGVSRDVALAAIGTAAARAVVGPARWGHATLIEKQIIRSMWFSTLVDANAPAIVSWGWSTISVGLSASSIYGVVDTAHNAIELATSPE